ncbi:MAG: hypothetical protein ACYTGG_10925 [Planctomycetota bacterium]|jgi:hypothetical protein
MSQLPVSTATPSVDAPADAAAPSNRSGGPLSAEHMAEIAAARERGRKLRRAIGVAVCSGWTTAVFAGLTLLMGLFDLTTFVLGAVLAAVAWNELAAAKLLRQLDERAPRRLSWNQLGLATAIIVYAAWGTYHALTGPGPYDSYLAQGGEVAEMLESVAALHTAIAVAVYISLVPGTIVLQGGAAWYYATRTRHLREYVLQTPGWIIDLQRTGSPM